MFRRFLKDPGGATAIEYGLVVALIALGIVLGVGSTGGALGLLWDDNNRQIRDALSSN